MKIDSLIKNMIFGSKLDSIESLETKYASELNKLENYAKEILGISDIEFIQKTIGDELYHFPRSKKYFKKNSLKIQEVKKYIHQKQVYLIRVYQQEKNNVHLKTHNLNEVKADNFLKMQREFLQDMIDDLGQKKYFEEDVFISIKDIKDETIIKAFKTLGIFSEEVSLIEIKRRYAISVKNYTHNSAGNLLKQNVSKELNAAFDNIKKYLEQNQSITIERD